MASGPEDRENSRLDEGQGFTEFGTPTRRTAWYLPAGRLGRFFSKFFGTKAKPYIAAEFPEEDHLKTTPPHPLAGDTVVNFETMSPGEPFALGSFSRNTFPSLTQQEVDRKKRYQEFEKMDDYPEISSAFDVYADDATQLDAEGRRWKIISNDQSVIDEVEALFEEIELKRYLWDIIRNMVKYGDCFVETIINLNAPKEGIKRLKILAPTFIYRVENEYGYLTDFLQEIPNKDDWSSYGMDSMSMTGKEYIPLDKHQLCHFRLHTSNPAFYPYGKSIAANAREIYRSLLLLEDAMLIYRLSRAPERRIFYLDTGNLPTTKAQMFVEKQKDKFKKEKYYHRSTNTIEARYNPLGVDEDYFLPVQKGSSTKIETLPGAQNLGEVDDVKYFRDKLLAILKVPKDYIVEKDKSPERKANLSQLDVKFAKVVCRVQQSAELGLENIVKRHLQLKGYPTSVIRKVEIKLPPPSDMFEKRRLDLEEQKAAVVQAVMGLGLFPKEKIYKEIYNLTEIEIEEIKDKLKEEMMEDPQAAMMGGAMGGAMPPQGGAMPPEEPSMQNPAPFSGGGGRSLAPQENVPPTSEQILKKLRKKMIIENSDPKKIAAITKRLARLKVKNNKN